MGNNLFVVQERNKLSQKGISIYLQCYGKQLTMEDMRAENLQCLKYKMIKSKPKFLRYTWRINEKIPKSCKNNKKTKNKTRKNNNGNNKNKATTKKQKQQK